MSRMDGVEWNGWSGIGMGWWSGMGLRSPERVGKTSETSENVGGGLNEIWYMTMALRRFLLSDVLSQSDTLSANISI